MIFKLNDRVLIELADSKFIPKKWTETIQSSEEKTFNEWCWAKWNKYLT